MAEWCTIESDPGLFTELIKNIGVKGVQVDEIIDLDSLDMNIEKVYGLIFLFKYMRNSGYNPQVLDYYDPDLYFANQVIENACATQAILGVLMNNEDKIDIGDTLRELKGFSKEMDPYMKGESISNCDKIREEHNKFSRPEPFVYTKEKATDGDDVFHFVAYIHFKSKIYEIDGLKKGPILIEDNVEYKDWIEKVKPSIKNRIALYANSEIKFNLLAVVPNKLDKALEIEKDLNERKNYISTLISGGDVNMDEKYAEYNNMSKENLAKALNDFESLIMTNKSVIQNENMKIMAYKEENRRRQHNYIPLIFELLKIMAEKGSLEDTYNNAQKVVEEKENAKKAKKEEMKKKKEENNKNNDKK